MKRIAIGLIITGVVVGLFALGVVPYKKPILGAVPNPQARHDHECSNASLKGPYGQYSTATIIPAGTPRELVGRETFDGEGNWFGTATVNNNGTVRHLTANGTYTVNPDCTGTFFNAEGNEILEGVLVDGAKEFRYINTGPTLPTSLVLHGVIKKQFPDDEDKD